MSREVVVLSAVRSAIGAFGGSLAGFEPGVLGGLVIKEAIARCDLFVLLWSQEARRSDWVPQEIGIADQQGKLIVPLVLEENLQLTGFISGLKYIDVTKDRQLAFKEAQSRVFEAVEKKKKLEQEKQNQNDALVFGALSLFLFWAFTQK